MISGWKLGWMTSKIVSTLKDILILNGKISLLLCLESDIDFGTLVIHPTFIYKISPLFLTFLLIIRLTVVAMAF